MVSRKEALGSQRSLQAQHVLHVVEPGRLIHDPLGGAQGAIGKSLAAGRPMGQFQPLAVGGKDDSVISHDVASAQGMDPDFVSRSFSSNPLPSMTQGFTRWQFSSGGENLRERRGGAAGRIFLRAMMHLHDFEIETRAQNLRGFAREPEKRVHAGGIVRRPHDWDLSFELCEPEFLGVGMAGGSDHKGLFVFGAKFGNRGRRIVKAEIDHHVSLADHGRQIIPLIDLTGHLKGGYPRRTRDERLAHASFGTCDDDSGHADLAVV